MSLNKSCDPCTRGDDNVPATKWCVDCEDALCLSCVKSHKVNKASMSHHVIDIEAISTLPGEVLTTQTKCSRHPDFNMDFFCNQHHVICCQNCMSEEHPSCNKVMPLKTASNNAKTSSLFHDISEGMKEVHVTLKKAVQNRLENRERMKIGEKTFVRQISAFKASLIKKLDELENSTLLEMQAVSQDSISQMEREESELEKSVSLVEKHLQHLDFLTKNGSNQHMFLLLHRLLPILSKEDNNLREVLANLSDASLVYDQPEHLFPGIKHLGTIRLKKEPCTIQLKPFKPPKSFKFSYRIDRAFDQVTGMVVDKDDNLILEDQSFLRMYSKDGKYVKECKLGGTAWDISYHKKSGRIVVTLQVNGIQFVDNFIAQQKISVNKITNCRGVTWVDDNVYVSGCDSSGRDRMDILNSNGQCISNISITNIRSISVLTQYVSGTRGLFFIHHRDNNIYYANRYKVYCIKKDGSKVFTYSFPELGSVYCIDTDPQGNAYVVVSQSNNILRLSPDGQNSDIIMKKGDGISNPRTLCFSRDSKKLFVSNEGGKRVAVYNCEY